MDLVAYLNNVEGLREVDRTVSAQLVSPTDNGVLRYPIYFPPQDVKSVKIGEILIGTYRPTASRREWNGPERLIPVNTPDTRDVEMIPVGAYFTLGEKEMNTYEALANGDEGTILRAMGGDVESRTDSLADASYRRVEVDAHHAWATGKIVQDDPTTGNTVLTDFLFGADRIQDASATPWNSTNFYTNLVAWLKEGKPAVGGRIEGVMLSDLKLELCKASGPTITLTGQKMKRQELEAEIEDQLGNTFRFVTNEDTVDVPVNGGLNFVNQRVFPETYLAAIPAGGRVGITARAPIVTASSLNREFPEAKVDRRGVVIKYITLNEGKGAKIASQLNYLSIPNKQRVWTMNAG